MTEPVQNITKMALMETELAVGLVEKFGLPTESLLHVLRHQIISVPSGAPEPTDAELALVLSMMKKYDLDPLARQMSAWRDNKGKLCIMVEKPGWVDFANRQPGFLGIKYKFGELMESPDGKGKRCWEWVQAILIDKFKGELPQVPVFLDEWYVKQSGNYQGNWQKYTRHRLAMKAHNLAIKEVYGMGAFDAVDHDQMVAQKIPYEDLTESTQATVDDLTARLADGKPEAVTEIPPEPDKEVFVEPESDEGALEVMSDLFATQDDPESTEPPVDMVPCSVKGCPNEAAGVCSECEIPLCGNHVNAGLCVVCYQNNL